MGFWYLLRFLTFQRQVPAENHLSVAVLKSSIGFPTEKPANHMTEHDQEAEPANHMTEPDQEAEPANHMTESDQEAEPANHMT